MGGLEEVVDMRGEEVRSRTSDHIGFEDYECGDGKEAPL